MSSLRVHAHAAFHAAVLPVHFPCMSMLHVHTECPPCISLPLFPAACPCCISLLHVSVSYSCCMHVPDACPWCFKFCMFILHVQAACPCYMLMSPCCISCCLSIIPFISHVYSACSCCMSMEHVKAPWSRRHAACPSRMQRSRRPTWTKVTVLQVFTSFNAIIIACPCERVQWVSISFQIVLYDTQKARIVTICLFARLMKSEYVLLPNFFLTIIAKISRIFWSEYRVSLFTKCKKRFSC
jgi:hypothetical protein